MRKLVVGCAVMGLIALSPKSESMPPDFPGPLTMVHQTPKGEIGTASWYGIERQGMPTTSGELFDENKLTAAHRKLPLGTMVRVTNLRNHRSTFVKVNDRGPGVVGRVIDVSWAAAKELGFLEAGLTRVEIDEVSDPTRCPHQPPTLRSPKAN